MLIRELADTQTMTAMKNQMRMSATRRTAPSRLCQSAGLDGYTSATFRPKVKEMLGPYNKGCRAGLIPARSAI